MKKLSPGAQLQALRKTKSGGRNGGRPRVNPPKPPRLEPFDRPAHMARMREAREAKRTRNKLDLALKMAEEIPS